MTVVEDQVAEWQAADLARLHAGHAYRAGQAQFEGLVTRLHGAMLAARAARPPEITRRTGGLIGGGAGLVDAIWTGGFPARVYRPHIPADRAVPLRATPGFTSVDLIDGEAWGSVNWYAVTAGLPGEEALDNAHIGVDASGPYYDLAAATTGATMSVESGGLNFTY